MTTAILLKPFLMPDRFMLLAYIKVNILKWLSKKIPTNKITMNLGA